MLECVKELWQRDGHVCLVRFERSTTPGEAAFHLLKMLTQGPPGYLCEPWKGPKWLQRKGGAYQVTKLAVVGALLATAACALATLACLWAAVRVSGWSRLLHLAGAGCAGFAAHRALAAAADVTRDEPMQEKEDLTCATALASATAAQRLQASALLSAGAAVVLELSARRRAAGRAVSVLEAAEAAAMRAAAGAGGQAAAAAAAAGAAGTAGGGAAAGAAGWAVGGLAWAAALAALAIFPTAVLVAMGSGQQSRASAACVILGFAAYAAAIHGSNGFGAVTATGAAALAVGLWCTTPLDRLLGAVWRPSKPAPMRYTYTCGPVFRGGGGG
jgi:hypothetical protein